MGDLKTAFRDADRIPAPDLWPEIESRIERPAREIGTRRRFLVAVAALGLFGGAATLLWLAFRPGGPAIQPAGPSEAVLEVMARPDKPVATLSYGGSSFRGIEAGYCWTEPSGETGCTEYFLLEPEELIDIPAGTILLVRTDAERLTALRGEELRLSETEPLDLSSGQIVLDWRPGEYLVKVEGEWPQGTATFHFPIRIVEEAEATEESGANAWCKEGVGCPDPNSYQGEDVPFERPGPSHCDWESETFIAYGSGQYMRDENNSLTSEFGVSFEEDASLPADAEYSGWHDGDRQLWFAASEKDETGRYLNIYIVVRDRVERWPRLDAACA